MKKFRKKLLNYMVMSACLVTALPAFALPANDTAVGRYLTIENKPHEYQVNLLLQVIQVRFPHDVQTIGDAMNYLLRFSGYSLVASSQINHEFKNTLAKNLPAVDRDFGPMSLKDALRTLAGPAFIMVEDPLNRTINFAVKREYEKYVPHENGTIKSTKKIKHQHHHIIKNRGDYVE